MSSGVLRRALSSLCSNDDIWKRNSDIGIDSKNFFKDDIGRCTYASVKFFDEDLIQNT